MRLPALYHHVNRGLLGSDELSVGNSPGNSRDFGVFYLSSNELESKRMKGASVFG